MITPAQTTTVCPKCHCTITHHHTCANRAVSRGI